MATEDRLARLGGRRARSGILACVAVLAALAAAGCVGSSATAQVIYLTPPPGPVTPLPSGVTPAPTIALPTPVIDSVVISSNAPDNSWTVTFKKPVVSGISDAAATAMNNAITDAVNGFVSAFTGGGLPAVASGEGPSTLEGDFSIALDSPTLVSLRFTMVTFVTGAAHPAETPGSLNFVVSSGAKINLTDLFTSPVAAVSTLSLMAHTQLSASLGTDLTWSGSAPSMTFFEKGWAMTPAGLEFTWAQGDIASEAAGMPSVTLAWPAIKSIILTSSPAGELVK
jgi:hypothetical protein